MKSSRPGERFFERVLTLGAVATLFVGASNSTDVPMQRSLYLPAEGLSWLLVAMAGAGFALCWWARIHLGQMWSANVVLKENHHIVDSGPYGLVRHPIYSGLLLAAWVTAALHANEASFLGAGLLNLAFYLKASSEESLLIAELGPPYEAYRRSIPMLIPRTLFRRRDP